MDNFFDHQEDIAQEGFASFNGPDVFANGNNELYANGGNDNGLGVNSSNPFIITLENTTVSAISNVVFLNAQSGVRDSTNYGVTAGVTPGYGIPNLDYIDFLYMVMTKPVLIGTTYIMSATAAQVEEPFTINTYDLKGGSAEQSVAPIINPDQNQDGRISWVYKFFINLRTKITINQIAANTKVSFYFYPIEEESTLGALTGNKRTQFSQPSISGVTLKS